MQNSILHKIYARYEKNVCKEKRLFQKYLQISFTLFFYNSCIFSFILQRRFSENQKFNFPAKIYVIRKKF